MFEHIIYIVDIWIKKEESQSQKLQTKSNRWRLIVE